MEIERRKRTGRERYASGLNSDTMKDIVRNLTFQKLERRVVASWRALRLRVRVRDADLVRVPPRDCADDTRYPAGWLDFPGISSVVLLGVTLVEFSAARSVSSSLSG